MSIRSFAKFFICILIAAAFSSVVAFAWTGPTQTAPNGNVSAPINVGTTDQTKNGGLGVNSLAVFGNAIISTVGGYLNFGTTAGASGYGIRDNAGILEFKNSGGPWANLTSIIQSFFATSSNTTVAQIKFTDGTTQTTAATGGGVSAVTTASCTPTMPQWGQPFACTVACPAGFYRTGCSGYSSYNEISTSAQPSGVDGCYCVAGTAGGVCYAYCAK